MTLKKPNATEWASMQIVAERANVKADATDLDGFYEALGQIKELDLSNTDFKDPLVLSVMTALERLSLRLTEVKNLKKMGTLPRLTTLDLSDTLIKDLTPLQSCPELTTLRLDGAKPASLEPLASVPSLRHLWARKLMGRTPFKGLEAVKSLETLAVYVGNHSVEGKLESLAVVAGSKGLRKLTVGADRHLSDDLSPIAALTELEELRLDFAPQSLDALGALQKLRLLKFSGHVRKARFLDLAPLAKLQQLKHLEFQWLYVSDVSALGALKNLETLTLKASSKYRADGPTDYSALGALTNLVELEVWGMAASRDCNYDWLQHLTQLQWLALPHSGFSDLTLLKGLTKLERLNLHGAQLVELAAARELPNLKMLVYGDCPVSDVSPLTEIEGYAPARGNVAGARLRGGELQYRPFVYHLPS